MSLEELHIDTRRSGLIQVEEFVRHVRKMYDVVREVKTDVIHTVILPHWTHDDFTLHITRRFYQNSLLFFSDDVVIGVLLCEPHISTTELPALEISLLWLLPEWRGKKVAPQVLKRFLKQHSSFDCYLECYDHLIPFYERFGAKETGQICSAGFHTMLITGSSSTSSSLFPY